MISAKSLLIAITLCVAIQMSASASVLRDSIGVETKDGKVYILHKVVSGETMYSVSKKYNTTPEILKQLNPELATGLKLGQVIRVPSKVVAPGVPANTSSTSQKIHTVAAGETLYSISRQYAVSVDEIKAANPGLGTLSVGQVIKIPVKAGQSAAPAQVAPANTSKYTVKAGDTFYSIATANKISVDQLKQLNPGIAASLTIGQVINVPAKPTTTATTTVPPAENADPTTQLTDNTVVPPVAPVVVAPAVPVTPPPAPAPAPAPAGPTPAEKQNLTPSTVPKPNADYKRMSEHGLAVLSADNNSKFFYAWHKTAPVGTVIQVTNEQTGQWIFVKVIGKLPENSGDKVVIKMTKKAWERLGATGDKISISLSYLL